MRMYSEWQKSKVFDDTLKAEFQKACDIMLNNGLDLEQVYEDKDPEFFIRRRVKKGIARRFVNEIEVWIKQTRLLAESHYSEL